MITSHPSHPAPVRIHLLGRFQVDRGAVTVQASDWGRRGMARTLLKILAVRPDHRMHREELLDLLWPDVDIDSGLNRFGKALYAARHALQPDLPARTVSSYLVLADNVLWLDMTHVWIDLDHFESLATRALTSGQEVDFSAALEAYAGELLPEDRYEDWAAGRRDALLEIYLRLKYAYAGALRAAGAYGSAIEQLRSILEHDPLREEAHRDVMRLYAMTGRRHQAIRQYQLLCETFDRELGTEPEPQTAQLHAEILAGQIVPAERPAEPAAPLAVPIAPLPHPLRRAHDHPLVGRDRVLSVLRSDLLQVECGAGLTTLISGESGVGKTRLTVELAHEAAGRGAVILWGTSYVRDHLSPYGPFVEAVENHLASRPPAEHARLAAQYPPLQRLIPSLAPGDASTQPPLLADVAHGQLMATFASLLGTLATQQPLVLVLDDLHAADTASLHLLQHLTRTAGNHRWLILGTYRDDEVPPGCPLKRLLSAVTQEGIGRRVSIGRLSREDTGSLVRSLLPGGVVDAGLLHRIYALSLGNPLFAWELLRAMREDGTLECIEDCWQATPILTSGVPRHAHDFLGHRLSDLGAPVRRVLNLAAIKGMEWSYPTLRLAATIAFGTAFDEEELLNALDQALDTGILEDRGDVFAFRHPLIREALLEQMPAHRAVRLHSSIAQAIEQERPGDVEALAHHYARSYDQTKAIEYLRQAADRALALPAPADAETLYRELIDRLDSRLLHADAARARDRLGKALIILARYDDALAELEQAAKARLAINEAEGLACTITLIARAHALRGTPAEGIARIEAVQQLLGDQISCLHQAAVCVERAGLLWSLGQSREQLRLTETAISLLDARLDEPDALAVYASAQIWRGIALLELQQVDDAVRVLEAAVPVVSRVGHLTDLWRVYGSLANGYEVRGERDRQECCIESALQAADRMGDPFRIAFALYQRGRLFCEIGRWKEAASDLEQSLGLARRTGRHLVPYCLATLASLALSTGSWDDAARYAEECGALARQTSNARHERIAERLLAELDLAQGRVTDAHQRITGLRASISPFYEPARLDLLLARVHLHSRNSREALPLLQGLLSAETAEPTPIRAQALLLWGIAATQHGELDEGARALLAAAQLARDLRDPALEARVLEAQGNVDLRRGAADAAEGRWREALALFRHLGAQHDAERLEQLLLNCKHAVKTA